MDGGNQQRILGYFIEEAKEHLDTLEQGLLNVQETAQDPEMVNEMFRAAHSVKGGAAMLGFSSLQKIAHRLEDCLKILKENPVKLDRHVESLFLQGYDTLKDLIEQLQGPYGIRDEEADKMVQAAEPTFKELQMYLERLIGGESPTAAPAKAEKAGGKAAAQVPENFSAQVTGILKQMLQLFKQSETAAHRQKLQEHCHKLAKLAQTVEPWQVLVKNASDAIANSQNSFHTLAPVIIKELKQASDQVQQGNENAVKASPALQKLAKATPSKGGGKEITITVEPKAAAKAIVKAFDKRQLTQLTKLLVQATRASS
ncbi:MAG: Hpt domain-containing protein [Coleofasciculus sp. C1-SOL-03]|uniref:Hpt domain-containing protein n=1 Tax=Coleofasciculus sp. C1-SOL-03 TaxID=3069522 RepID=UPI0032FFF3AF